MQKLEQLYNSAESWLGSEQADWDSFCADISKICDAHIALYRTKYDPENGSIVSADYIATTDPVMVNAYKNLGLQNTQPIPENSLTPLEPLRRTDIIDDETYMAIPAYGEFARTYGYFYQMMTPAILPDKSILGLLLWRNETQEDFSDLEKQRAALFMRHLMGSVYMSKIGETSTGNKVDDFGKRHNLTPTETDILAALLNGHSLREISEATDRSYGTVRWHVQNILDKCQVSSQKSLLSEFYGLIEA